MTTSRSSPSVIALALRSAAGLTSGSHPLDRLSASGRQLAHVLAHALHRPLTCRLGVGAELLDVGCAGLTHNLAGRPHRWRGRRAAVNGSAVRWRRHAGAGCIRSLGGSSCGTECKQQDGGESGFHFKWTFGVAPETPGGQINVREPPILRSRTTR